MSAGNTSTTTQSTSGSTGGSYWKSYFKSSTTTVEGADATTSLLGNIRQGGQGKYLTLLFVLKLFFYIDVLSSVGIGGPSSEDLDCLGLNRFQRYGCFIVLLGLSFICFSMALFSVWMIALSKLSTPRWFD